MLGIIVPAIQFVSLEFGNVRETMHFKWVGNMGCRMWWGGGDLNDRDLGGHGGGWLMGVNGPREGRYDTKFVKWCVRHRLLYVRTVDLFWALEYHRRGFPSSLNTAAIRRTWTDEKEQRREAAMGIKEDSRRTPKRRLEYLDYWYPDPGPWKDYYKRQRVYFLTELARYKRVLKFWRECGDSVREAFRQCARYSNKRAESHPDYFVVFREGQGRMVEFGFVEVKGPRESLRPTQRRFFPELVRCAGRKIWLARLTVRGTDIKFAKFMEKGQLVSCFVRSETGQGQIKTVRESSQATGPAGGCAILTSSN